MSKIAVWDTYVPLPDGAVLHFDILVPDSITDPEVIYAFGKKYLQRKGHSGLHIQSGYCQFCHLEDPEHRIMDTIKTDGFYILEMETIPSHLQENSSRRDLILYLRAHHGEHRFADFRGKTIEELRQILDAKRG